MKYSHDYSKLQKQEYTTIRRHSKGKIGDVKKEVSPNRSFYAIIQDVKRKALDDIDLKTLQDDTDLKERDEIYHLFQSFYQKPIDYKNEKFYLYSMKKLNDMYFMEKKGNKNDTRK